MLYNNSDNKKMLFWLKVEVRGLSASHPDADELKQMFITRLSEKYDVYLKENLYVTGGIFAVEFRQKENARIELNIFASEMEEQYGQQHPHMEWYMQSTSL